MAWDRIALCDCGSGLGCVLGVGLGLGLGPGLGLGLGLGPGLGQGPGLGLGRPGVGEYGGPHVVEVAQGLEDG